MLLLNGWTLYAHPLFLDQLERLMAAVERQQKVSRQQGAASPNAKLLAMIRRQIFTDIPTDPAQLQFRQGNTLGPARRHWFRAKFGNGRFRLFFRFDTASKIILYAWVNDETTLRAYGSRRDAYAVFAGMLDRGNPPEDWDILLAACRAAAGRLEKARGE